MHRLVRDIAAGSIATAAAASAYWLLDRTHWLGDVVGKFTGLGQVWFVVYFSCMAVVSAVALLVVGRVFDASSWKYLGTFALLGLVLHMSIYNFFHAGWVAGIFGNGFYAVAAILYWAVAKNVTNRSNPTPKSGAV